jgi:hypothetical protein
LNILVTSPPLSLSEMGSWARNLIGGEVILDQTMSFKIVNLLQFQVISQKNAYQVIGLVELSNPVIKLPEEQNG